MKAYTQIETFQELCRISKKYGLYISFQVDDLQEIIKAAPYLKGIPQMLCDGCGFFLFETEEELNHYYKMTVGDDGPSEVNTYDGEATVYALTCNPEGQLLTENT